MTQVRHESTFAIPIYLQKRDEPEQVRTLMNHIGKSASATVTNIFAEHRDDYDVEVIIHMTRKEQP